MLAAPCVETYAMLAVQHIINQGAACCRRLQTDITGLCPADFSIGGLWVAFERCDVRPVPLVFNCLSTRHLIATVGTQTLFPGRQSTIQFCLQATHVYWWQARPGGVVETLLFW